jgi:hypothetical protein
VFLIAPDAYRNLLPTGDPVAETKYRLNNPAGTFPAGMIVTQKEIEDSGFDFDFWERTKTISKANADDQQVEGAHAILDDAAMKAEIEAEIRARGATHPREQDAIAVRISRTWADRRAERADAQAEELRRSGGGQGAAGREKPGDPNKTPTRVAEAKVGGRPLSDYDGKSDDEIRKMIAGNDRAAKDALVRDVRAAQAKAKDADPGQRPAGGASTELNARNA